MTLDKWQGIFILGAMGDACGHMKGREFSIYEYSDDTVLTLATAVALKFCQTAGWTPANVMKTTQNFVIKDEETRISKHPRDFGEKTRKLMSSWTINSAHEKGNWDTCGLVMKISPLACLKHLPSLSDVSIAGHYTHGKNETSVLIAFTHISLLKWLMEMPKMNKEDVLRKVSELISPSNDPFVHVAFNAIKQLPFSPVTSPFATLFGSCGRTKSVVVYFCALWFVLPYLNEKNPVGNMFPDMINHILSVDTYHDTDTIAKLAGELLGARFGLEGLKGSWFTNTKLENIHGLAETAKMCFEF
jgi:ADP-ribosylglycohydrolase